MVIEFISGSQLSNRTLVECLCYISAPFAVCALENTKVCSTPVICPLDRGQTETLPIASEGKSYLQNKKASLARGFCQNWYLDRASWTTASRLRVLTRRYPPAWECK